MTMHTFKFIDDRFCVCYFIDGNLFNNHFYVYFDLIDYEKHNTIATTKVLLSEMLKKKIGILRKVIKYFRKEKEIYLSKDNLK